MNVVPMSIRWVFAVLLGLVGCIPEVSDVSDVAQGGSGGGSDVADAGQGGQAQAVPFLGHGKPKKVLSYEVSNLTLHVDHGGPYSILATCHAGDSVKPGSGVCSGGVVLGSAATSAQDGWECTGTVDLGMTIQVHAKCLHTVSP